MFSLPFDLMREFRRRPKAKKSNEMREQKEALTGAIFNHMKLCVQLKEDEENFLTGEYGFFEKMKKQRELDAKIS